MEAEQLPVGWVKASLDDLIVYTLGGDWGKDADFDDTDFVQVRCIRASELRNWEREKGKTAAQRRVKKSSLDARKLKDGDILVEISGGGPEQPVGRTVVIDKTVLAQNPNTPKICTDFFRLARPSTQLVAAYLNHYLQFFYQSGRIGEYQGGSNNLRNLKFNYYLGITIPVPPITEQKRIITKIEELFSELDKGVESLRTAREQLKVYHLSILDQATGGAQSIGYETRILGDLIGPIQLGWSPKCDLRRQPLDNEWAIIKTTAIQPMHYLPHECKPLPETLEPRSGIEVQDGDILMTRKGPRPRTGVVCYVRKARPRSMLCDTVYRFRASESVVLPEYLEIALNAPRVLAEINEKKSGISDSGISLNHGRLRSIPVPIPSEKDRQVDIVRSVEQKLSVAANIEAVLDQQFEQCEVLRLAILQKAFAGQLVAQDPKDEPASFLLERIKVEKKAHAKDNKSNKRRNAA